MFDSHSPNNAMEMKSTKTHADTALSKSINEILKALEEIDEGDENIMQTMVEGQPAAEFSLEKLRNKVQTRMETKLKTMKQSLAAGGGNLGLYLRLTDALLCFQHWSADIIVRQMNPLIAIEQDELDEGFAILAANLRTYFAEILEALSEFE